MAVKFSENQNAAITVRNKSLVISASAGSGKTTVLVERVLKMVCEENVSLENLAVVTFTNAAAAGIKDKLRKALNERLSKNPSDEHIRKQLLLIGNADISTVHSFCGRIIKKYSHVLRKDIPSNVRLLNDTEDKLLRQEVLEELFDDYYFKEDEDFISLIECYSPGRNDDALIKLMLGMYEYVCSIPFYSKWIEKSLSFLESGEGFEKSPAGKALKEYIDRVVCSAVSKYKLAVEYTKTTEGLEKQTDVYKSELSAFLLALNQGEVKSKLEILSSIPFVTLPRAKPGSDTSVSKAIRDGIKDKIREITADFSAFLMPDKENLRAVKKFFSVIMEFDSVYKERKYEKGTISFMDQEHLAIEILEDDGISKELKEKYCEVMVDEFQDTNSVQEYIFSRIAKENNLFTVGDVKQSIYRFRHANPSIFTKKIEKGITDENTRTIYLNENFRSSDNVADFANLIFSYIMNSETSFSDYNKTDMLVAKKGVKKDIYAPEVILCDAGLKDDDGVSSSEAGAIADKINSMILDMNFTIGAEERRLKYSDIVILTRNFNDKTLKFLAELTSLGIPCKYDDKINLFETAEIKTVLALLKVADNPLDDISLIAVLRNIFSLSDQQIFNMRKAHPKKDFYAIIKAERKDIYDYLYSLRLYCAKYSLSAVIEKIYEDFLIPEKWTAMYSAVRKDNLMKLYELAEGYEENGFKGISAFIKYVNRIIATKEKLPSTDNSLSTDNDYVRVMTIHKSKGLEFPVVFLAGCGTKLNKSDITEMILADSELGIGIINTDSEKRIKTSTVIRDVIAKKELYELLSEEQRLLYVALTRAEYKIIVTGTVNNPEKRFAAYSASCYNLKFKMAYTDFLKVNCYLDFIMPPLMFTGALAPYGTNIPTELSGSLKDILIKFSLYEGVKKEDGEESESAENIRNTIPLMKYEETYKLFSYKGEYKNIPKKVSVTALNSLKENATSVVAPAPELYIPTFLSGDTMSDKRRGTMLHYIFEKLSLEKLKMNKDLLSAVEDIMKKNSVIWENITINDLRKVEAFFESPLGIKMLRSNKVLREKEFIMYMDSEEVFGTGGGKKIMIQGIIDCCFWDNMDKLWLVDYKYTRLTEEKIRETYKYQLELYKKALSKIYGIDEQNIHSYIWDINRSLSYKI